MAPLPAAGELVALFRDYEDQASAEARFVRACNKLDTALQAHVYARDQAIDTAEFITSALATLQEPSLRALIGSLASSASGSDH